MRSAWREPFLACLAEESRETVCAELAGVDRRTVCYAKQRDPEFREQVEAAHAARVSRTVDQSLHRLRRRATAEL